MLIFPCSLNSPPFLLSFSSFLIFSFLAPPASVSLSFLSSPFLQLSCPSFPSFLSLSHLYVPPISFPLSLLYLPSHFLIFLPFPFSFFFLPRSSPSLLLLLLPFLYRFFPFLPLTPLCPSFNSLTELCWSQITSNASPPTRFPSLHFYCFTLFIKLSKFPYTFSVSLKGQSW